MDLLSLMNTFVNLGIMRTGRLSIQTYDDARQVIEHVQKTVQEKFGVWLELEVRMIE